jgi:elongation factor P
MSMLEYNEIVERKYIVLDGQPYEVVSSHVFRKQQRKPVNATKLKNLITKKVTEYSFHVSEKVEEAEIESREIKYLYANTAKKEYWFCLPTDPSKRFSFTEDEIGTQIRFMKLNAVISQLQFGDKTTGFKVPILAELKVTEAPPNIKGDSATGGNKTIVLETGVSISAPLFVMEGDVIRVNTETGEYKDRVGK